MTEDRVNPNDKGGIDWERLEQLQRQYFSELQAAKASELKEIKLRYLSRNGELYQALQKAKAVEDDESYRRFAIPKLQAMRLSMENAWVKSHDEQASHARKEAIEKQKLEITLPGDVTSQGGTHPLTQTLARILSFFRRAGFCDADGPEIERSYYNFEALNFPSWHPALSRKDSFWLSEQKLLRTHTSGVQIRTLEEAAPPLRIFSAGRVYRPDSDATHTPMFHQVEGLMVDRDVSFSDLKGTLESFLNYFFEGMEVEVRFRPSYFPFTVPSAEVDIRFKEDKEAQWLEVLGCGMVHPNVLKVGGVDPRKMQGYAFGMGVERFAMLRYGVKDIRSFFENDTRFLKQFSLLRQG